MVKILSPRLQAALRYLKSADPFYKWRISKAPCPSCKGEYFISLSKDGFMTRCLGCAANVTNLAIIPVIKQHQEKHPIQTAWEMSTFGGTLKYLRNNYKAIITSEYFSNAAPGELVDGVLNQDVQQLTFPDESIDLITSNQVFEHVIDDLKGFQECYRVLRKKGALIFTIPLHDIPCTKQKAEMVGNQIQFRGEPEYHDSRSTGPRTVPVFWHHSMHDICDRVAKVGFRAQLMDIIIPPSQKIPSKVIYAVKE